MGRPRQDYGGNWAHYQCGKTDILAKRVKEDLVFSHSDLIKDWKGFLKHVTSRPRHCAEFEDDQKKKEGIISTPHSFKFREGEKHRTPFHNNENGEKAKAARKKQLPDCWNQRCNGKHKIKDCPNTKPEMRT